MMNKKIWWALFFYFGLAMLTISGIVIIVPIGRWMFREYEQFPSALTLTVLLIAGVACLLIVLSTMVAIFAGLNLSQRTHSLGLPEGSVRAVIALSLILIFAMQAVYLYSDLAQMDTKLSTMTEAQLEAFPKENILSIEPTTVATQTLFLVETKVEKSQASTDFAKQIFTTISTLIVAIAGFYFGSKAVLTARGETDKTLPPPEISRIEPPEGPQGAERSLRIFGNNFQAPQTVKLTHPSDVTPISGEGITASATEVRCDIKIPDKAQTEGKWDVVVVNEDGSQKSFAKGFTVTSPPPTIREVKGNPVVHQGDEARFTVVGQNFHSADFKLTYGAEDEIPCTVESTISTTELQVKGAIGDQAPIGQWALAVVNQDGQKGELNNALTVKRPLPQIIDVSPKTGQQGESVAFTISGQKFQSPVAVTLRQGNNEMPAELIFPTGSDKLRCNLAIGADKPIGAWDLIVINLDGQVGEKADAFTVEPLSESNSRLGEEGQQANEANKLVQAMEFVDGVKKFAETLGFSEKEVNEAMSSGIEQLWALIRPKIGGPAASGDLAEPPLVSENEEVNPPID